MLKFNDYLKEAKELSPKQKKIAAIAGDKDKIDADDLAALRAGKKPVDECDYGKMKKEELVGNQYKLDKNKNGKIDADDFKKLRKEEAEQIDELSKKTLGSYVNKAAKDSRYMGQIATDFENQGDKARKQSKKDSFERLHRKYLGKSWKRESGIAKAVDKLTKEDVQIDEGRMKDLAYDLQNMGHNEFHKHYGHPKHHYDPTNFKKPVQPGHEMERAKELAQRGMKSVHEQLEEATTRKDFQMVADLIKGHESAEKRKELATHHAGIFAKQNPRFDHAKFMKAAGVNESEMRFPKDGWSQNDSMAKPVSSGKAMADHSKYFNKVVKLDPKTGKPVKEEAEQIDELSKKTLGSYVNRAANQAIVKSLANPADKSDDMNTIAKREKGINLATKKLAKEEVEQEMSPYVKGTLAIMDEGKIDDLRDAQKLRQASQSAYDKNYKPDTSHPHIQVVKGTAYGGENQKDDEHDEKPEAEKKGRGRPSGSKSGARLKGGGHEDGGIPVHNLHLPKSHK